MKLVNLSRRKFIKGTATGAAGTALAGTVLTRGPSAAAATLRGQDTVDSYPFHGTNQSGVLTPGPFNKQPFTCVASFDSTAGGPDDLAGLLQALTASARFLTAGGTPPNLGPSSPPSDSDILGPVVPADGLTVTVSVGSSLFDDRYGLGGTKPLKLTQMPAFPDDSLQDVWLDGDLLVQVCANHPDTVHHAIRDITVATSAGMQPNWKIEGFGSPPRPSGSGRNLLGFKDGIANPTGGQASGLVWVNDPAEPNWAQNGSYLVVRLIRMLTGKWDGASLDQQQKTIGRFKDSGAPLDGTSEFDPPNYGADPNGNVIPLSAHMRLANPDTPQTDNQRLIRRGYNYDLGIDQDGNMQAGLIFIAYQQDVDRQFAAVQNRLIGEPLAQFVVPFGGGYFFTLPGVRDDGDWYGKDMIAQAQNLTGRAPGDREEAGALGRQRVKVVPPDGGELPLKRRAGDLDGDQAAEDEVIADGQPAEHAGADARRDRRTHGGARAELHRDPRAQRRVLRGEVVGQRVPCPAAGLPHDQRRGGDLGQRQRAAAARPRVTRRGDHEHLVVPQVRGHQAGRQVRGLDEAEPDLDVPDELDDPGGVGHGELHDGLGAVRRRPRAGVPRVCLPRVCLPRVCQPRVCQHSAGPLGRGLLDAAQLDQPVRYQVLGDGLAGGDGQPVRHPGPDGPQPRLEAVGGVEHVLGPADDEASLLGEVRPGRGAGEQGDAHGSLQGAHPGGQRLLRNAEHGGGARDGPLPAHLAQRPQRPQVMHGLDHGGPPSFTVTRLACTPTRPASFPQVSSLATLEWP
jgi:deferrochelatase/peroxidase EfeB